MTNNTMHTGQKVINFGIEATVEGFHEVTGDPILRDAKGARWVADAAKCEPAPEGPGMSEYAKLLLAEGTCHTVEIREKATGKEGVANSCADGVELFYGADDGSDDKVVSAEEFSRDFEITAMVAG